MIDLREATFIIPVKFDSEDRKNNFRKVLSYILETFDTNVIVCEYSDESSFVVVAPDMVDKVKYVYINAPKDMWHKTYAVNCATKFVETPVMILHDCDIFIDPQSHYHATQMVLQHNVDFVYPCKNFYTIGMDVTQVLLESTDITSNIRLLNCVSKSMNLHLTFAGCVVCSTRAFLSCGMLNEYFVMWGLEDGEFYTRIAKLGYKIEQIPGCMIHLYHMATVTSRNHNTNEFVRAEEEYEKVVSMTAEQLRTYVDLFPWRKKVFKWDIRA